MTAFGLLTGRLLRKGWLDLVFAVLVPVSTLIGLTFMLGYYKVDPSLYLDAEGYFRTKDGGRIDEDGYLWIMSRTDDIINVAGHRLSTGGMEEVLADHPDVAECAVIGVKDSLKGQVPLGFVVLNVGAELHEGELVAELVARVRQEIGAVAAFKQACVVSRLPKTRSGKILRKVIRAIADGKEFAVPSTIDDPEILKEIEDLFKEQMVGSFEKQA